MSDDPATDSILPDFLGGWREGGPSGASQFVRGHEAGVPQGPQSHPAAGSDGQPRDAAVVQAHPQPALRGELQSPASGEGGGQHDLVSLARSRPVG